MNFSAENNPFKIKGVPVIGLQGYDNGSFVLQTADDADACHLQYDMFDAKGKMQKQITVDTDNLSPAKNYIPLSEDRYAVMTATEMNTRGKVFYTHNDIVAFDNVYGVKVFPNGWYILYFEDTCHLYDNKDRLMAQNFQRCQVLKNGYYALQNNRLLITSRDHYWSLYCNQKEILKLDNVISFLGSDCMLCKNDDKEVLLSNFLGEPLQKMPVATYEQLLDHRFLLTFTNGAKRLYKPDGTPQGESISNDILLADACSVTKDRHLITGLFQPSGIMDKERGVPTAVQTYGLYYYRLEWFDKNCLYDSNGINLGENHTILGYKDNFLVTERAGMICIFNQFGCSWTHSV